MCADVMSHPFNRQYTASHEIVHGHFRLKRPRSTPSNGTRPTTYTPMTDNGRSSKMNRPKTAAAVLALTRECDRVSQLEHEPTRRHNLDPHMATKKNKPPPWQSKIDPPLVPFVVAPGYILSRSKSKFAVTLKDELFEPIQDDEVTFSPSTGRASPHQVPVWKKQVDHERDNLIANLQQQISDLNLYLEEERLNHKQTKQKGEDMMKDKLEELSQMHAKQMADQESEYQDELQKLQKRMENEHTTYKSTAEGQIGRMRKEIEFLQGAFDSYKSSLHQEMDAKWNRKQDELTAELEQQKEKEMLEMRSKFISDKNMEKVQLSKDHYRSMEALRRENKRDLDAVVRKFSNVAADLERLQKTTAELEEVKAELAIMTEQYNDTCKKLTNITRTLTDTKVRLMAFEEQFDQKVQEVDERYKRRIDDLMTQNTDMKRLYVQKCGDLFEEKMLFEKDRTERVMTARETMQSMLKSKHRADVSFTPTDQKLADKERIPKTRPGSAPITRYETQMSLLSAGEVKLVEKDEEVVRPTVILPEDSEEITKMRQRLEEEIKQVSKEDLIKSFGNSLT